MKFSKLIKRVRPGEMLPPFYGIAWRDYSTYEAVCLPVPLNLIVWVGRNVWAFCKQGAKALPESPREAYEQGVRDGRAAVAKKLDIDTDFV